MLPFKIFILIEKADLILAEFKISATYIVFCKKKYNF